MRITKSNLKKIIKEETEKLAQEISQEGVPSKFYDMGETAIYGDASIADVAATGRPLAGTSEEAAAAYKKAKERMAVTKEYKKLISDPNANWDKSDVMQAHWEKQSTIAKRIGNWLSTSTEADRIKAGWKKDFDFHRGWTSPDTATVWTGWTPEERRAGPRAGAVITDPYYWERGSIITDDTPVPEPVFYRWTPPKKTKI